MRLLSQSFETCWSSLSSPIQVFPIPGLELLCELHIFINKRQVLLGAVELMEEAPCPRVDRTIP